MNSIQRQRLLLILAGLAVALLVSDRLIFTPLSTRWKERSEEISRLKQSVEQGSMLLDREESIRQRWISMKTNALPYNPSSAESTLLRSFEQWSKTSRISVSSMKPQWNQLATNAMALEYRADAFGDLGAITRFLYELENDPLAYRIESMNLSTQDKEGTQLSLNLKMSGLLLDQSKP